MYVHITVYLIISCCRQTVGTGFIGYAKCRDKYITVLVTANHVIPEFEDAKASRIAFENLLPDSKKLVLKGFEIFIGSFWSSPQREVCMLISYAFCVLQIVHGGKLLRYAELNCKLLKNLHS